MLGSDTAMAPVYTTVFQATNRPAIFGIDALFVIDHRVMSVSRQVNPIRVAITIPGLLLLFVLPTAVTAVTAESARTVTVKVDASAARHAISPLIYGVAFGGSLLHPTAIPLDRWG